MSEPFFGRQMTSLDDVPEGNNTTRECSLSAGLNSKSVVVEGFRIDGLASADAIGGYGVVVSATKLKDAERCVAKFFGYAENRPDVSWIMREIDNLRHLQGLKGVVEIKGTFLDSPQGHIVKIYEKRYKRVYPVIVMERCDGGDLFSRMDALRRAGRGFTEAHCSKIFRSFIAALAEVHGRNMINCDLKTENLVFKSRDEEDLEVKIIDFGLATHLWDRAVHFDDRSHGTEIFMAPESIEKNAHEQTQYSRATDIWQAGCILYLMLTMQYPFGERDARENILNPEYFVSKLQATPNISDLAKDLLFRIFQYDPKYRITAEDILNHPWIANVAALSQVDLGPEHATRTKSMHQQYIIRRLLNQKARNDSYKKHKLLELHEQTKSRRSSRLENCDTPGVSSPHAADGANSEFSETDSNRKRQQGDMMSPLGVDVVTPKKISRFTSIGGTNTDGDGRSGNESPISLRQFRQIRDLYLDAVKRKLESQEPCTAGAGTGNGEGFVNQLYEFAGLEFDHFIAIAKHDSFGDIEFLQDPAALVILDSNANNHVDYLELMLGLGPLVCLDAATTLQCVDAVPLTRQHTNSNSMTLAPEIYFEIFNIFQNDVISHVAVNEGLRFILGSELWNEVSSSGSLPAQDLNKQDFLCRFSNIITQTRPFSRA